MLLRASRHLKVTAMLASIVLRASLVLIGLLIPYVVAAPGSTTVVTPYGERPGTEVHVVPDGMHTSISKDYLRSHLDTIRISQGLVFTSSAKKPILLTPPAMSLTFPP
jgi:hypothetical protein